jgi:hypothetical protein
MADGPGAGDAGKAHQEKDCRKRGNADPGHGFEEGPEIGEERELAHEQQEHRRHAERDLPALEQPEHIARSLAPAGRQRRHAGPLPDEREQRQRHDKQEGAAPADMIAKQAGERGGNGRGDGVAGIDHRQCPGHGLFRHEAHDNGRGH